MCLDIDCCVVFRAAVPLSIQDKYGGLGKFRVRNNGDVMVWKVITICRTANSVQVVINRSTCAETWLLWSKSNNRI
jgi:hypothetical protein